MVSFVTTYCVDKPRVGVIQAILINFNRFQIRNRIFYKNRVYKVVRYLKKCMGVTKVNSNVMINAKERNFKGQVYNLSKTIVQMLLDF